MDEALIYNLDLIVGHLQTIAIMLSIIAGMTMASLVIALGRLFRALHKMEKEVEGYGKDISD